jgi:hypothetical protein
MSARSLEGLGIGRCSTLILHRNPEVHGERFIGQRMDLGDDLLNGRRSQVMRAERTQTLEV